LNQTVANFAPEGHLLTEAVFVPRDETAAPTASNEDDGALLTLAFNTKTKKSTIFAINATDFSELFAVELPFGVPIHFHGIFCKELQQGVAPQDRFCLWN
jgi:carotenoid cleavage dioxygenase-like enzyme